MKQVFENLEGSMGKVKPTVEESIRVLTSQG